MILKKLKDIFMKLYQKKFSLLNKKIKFIKFIKYFLNTNKAKNLLLFNTISFITSINITKNDIKQIFLFFLPQYKIENINSLIYKKKIKKIYLKFKY